MITYLTIIISQLFLLTSCEKGNIEPPTLSKKIENKVTKIAKNRKIPSLELTITTENDVIDFNYHNKKVEKQDIYGIGSTTKLLSAVLIFKLIEDEKLKLDDKVVDYVNLTQRITGIENLTIKDLLNHTSGLSDFTQNPDWIKRITENNAPKTFEEKIAFVNDKTKNSGRFSYSNTNYLILQKITESITDELYYVYFNNFYESNGLSNIKMGLDESGLQSFYAQTKEESSNNVSALREYYGFAGGAYSDTKTLDNFLIKLYKEKSILKSSTMTEMEEWISTEPMSMPIGTGKFSEYGYGIMKLMYNGDEYIGHTGSSFKYQCMVLYNSEKNISISILTNCSGKYFNNVFFQELIPAILDEL